MLPALVSALILGALVSIEPTPVIALVAILLTDRAVPNALAFLAGWAVSTVVVFAAAFVVVVGHLGGTGVGIVVTPLEHQILSWVELALGGVLAGFAVRHWLHRNRPRPDHSGDSRFDRLRPLSAAGVGAVARPWAVTAAAGAVVARDGGALAVIVASAGFFVVSSLTVTGLTVYRIARSERASSDLRRLRAWLQRIEPVGMSAIAAAAALYLVVDGIGGLVTT